MFASALRRRFASILDITVVDTSQMLKGSPNAEECRKVVEGFYNHGVIAIKDPRVNEGVNQNFLRMMEGYYESRQAQLQPGKVLKDARPQWGYQVGVTPELIERARNHAETIKEKFQNDKPVTPQPPPADGKWRYFWRIGDTETIMTDFKSVEQVVPEDFPQWQPTMDKWGQILNAGCFTVSEMLALGLGMQKDTFTSKMKGAVQLLAPTGSNLAKYNKKDDILAGFHYDLNFLTIHGRSNFPGLSVWLRTGEKVEVKVPEGCLLLQVGKQMEWMTGGHFYAGFHEVTVTDATLEAIQRAKKEGRSLWRVSSTLFSGLRYDQEMKPLALFRKGAEASKYPPINVGKFVEEELKMISLLPTN
jgi:isopenicillin N synthase-like dioxygenase